MVIIHKLTFQKAILLKQLEKSDNNYYFYIVCHGLY